MYGCSLAAEHSRRVLRKGGEQCSCSLKARREPDAAGVHAAERCHIAMLPLLCLEVVSWEVAWRGRWRCHESNTHLVPGRARHTMDRDNTEAADVHVCAAATCTLQKITIQTINMHDPTYHTCKPVCLGLIALPRATPISSLSNHSVRPQPGQQSDPRPHCPGLVPDQSKPQMCMHAHRHAAAATQRSGHTQHAANAHTAQEAAVVFARLHAWNVHGAGTTVEGRALPEQGTRPLCHQEQGCPFLRH